MFRRAAGPKGGTLLGLDRALQDETALALRRFSARTPGQIEPPLRIIGGVFVLEREAAPRDLAQAAPLAGADAEDLADQLLGLAVALAADRAGILVLDLCPPLFKLLHAQEDPLEDIQRLEAGDDDGNPVALCNHLILRRAHHRADVTGR